MAEDNALISLAKSGDEQAFADLMRAHYAFVYRIVVEIVNNPHDAEEVVQDTFLNVYRGLTEYEERTKFRSWLAKIARNRALNWRREQRADIVSIDDVGESTVQAADSLDERLIRDEQRELIRRAMGALSQKDRDIAWAYYLDGASYDELIRTHGLSYKAISFRLSRAKRTLEKRLQYLLTGAFVPPATTLKKIISGGFTAMKIGTVPKITVGVIAIVVIVFIGSRQLLSPREDSSSQTEVVTSKTSKSVQSALEIDTRRGEIASPARTDEQAFSVEEMEQIEAFFSQFDAADPQMQTDVPQLATEAEINQTDGGDTTDAFGTSEITTQSAEDVMNAYVEALKTLDFEAMLSLETATAREKSRDVLDGFDSILSNPMAREMFQSMVNQAEIVGSEYVGDEFHFRLRVPFPRMPVLDGLEFPEGLEPPESVMRLAEIPESDISVYKMRKEDSAWRIFKQ